MGANTIKLGTSESPCPACIADSIDPPFMLEPRMEVSATGIAQMLVMFCSKHGPVKRLFSDKPTPTFKAMFPEFFEGEYGPIIDEPKPTKWV